MPSTDSLLLRVHRVLKRTRVEGPGERACIWVQGCTIRCPGCAVPWTWPRTGGAEISVERLEESISAEAGLEGVTFLGGEPFEQAVALASLARSLRRKGLGVVVFSGYTLQHLTAGGGAGWLELLSETDLLIDGPYEKEKGDMTRPWVGSTNKRYHFLTSRYDHDDIAPETRPNRVEFRIMRDGTVRVNGMMSQPVLHQIQSGLFEKPQG